MKRIVRSERTNWFIMRKFSTIYCYFTNVKMSITTLHEISRCRLSIITHFDTTRNVKKSIEHICAICDLRHSSTRYSMLSIECICAVCDLRHISTRNRCDYCAICDLRYSSTRIRLDSRVYQLETSRNPRHECASVDRFTCEVYMWIFDT